MEKGISKLTLHTYLRHPSKNWLFSYIWFLIISSRQTSLSHPPNVKKRPNHEISVIRGSLNKTFLWALLLIVHTWNSSPLQSNLHLQQCTCCTVPSTSEKLHGSPLVWACQWLSSQHLSSPELSHNDSLWT